MAKKVTRKKATVKNAVVDLVGEMKHTNGLEAAILGQTLMVNPYGESVSQSTLLWKQLRNYLVSNMRNLLSQLYVEQGLVQTLVDVPVDDAMRGGVEIKTKQLSEEEIEKLVTYMERNGDLPVYSQGEKWKRLFGGGGILIMTDQAPDTVLDIEKIKKGDKVEFRAVDLWELFWSKNNTGDDYSVSHQFNLADQMNGNMIDTTEYFDYYGIKVHKSRVIILKGKEAPSFVRPRMRGWGVSVVESMVQSINQYLKSINLTYEVLDEFKLDIFKINKLASTALSPTGFELIQKRIRMLSQQKNYQNAMAMDKEDDYVQKQLSFAGLSETMTGIRMQIASDMRMPLTKVFGISSAGFNSGEDDIENYNAMIEGSIREKAKFNIIQMISIRCMELFGTIPDDLTITFKSLRVLSSEAEENVKTQKMNRLVLARDKGIISAKEFKEACNRDKLLPIQLDPNDEVVVLPDAAEDEASSTTPIPKSKLSAPESKS